MNFESAAKWKHDLSIFFFKSGRIVIIVLVAVAAATTYALDGEWVPKALSYD